MCAVTDVLVLISLFVGLFCIENGLLSFLVSNVYVEMIVDIAVVILQITVLQILPVPILLLIAFGIYVYSHGTELRWLTSCLISRHFAQLASLN
ncbi:hypothetical protein JAAARDRAFT_196386 [Jaapia argillacea MUCL 33604]|uniref:Uncharacterized protein n=1 Tax=Jaapia argillacea MUCL 33604 TaxID=933084 RepID=A0A067PI74_9AGAM|nr:hypothetical protein JAAARDRAFT_196386 [Jaapia argillacea MUCL 33604]